MPEEKPSNPQFGEHWGVARQDAQGTVQSGYRHLLDRATEEELFRGNDLKVDASGKSSGHGF